MKELLEPDKHGVEWPNTGPKEIKARKLEGRARQLLNGTLKYRI